MNLPPKLEELLKKDSVLHGSVLVSYAEFSPWLRASGTPFFPEYTDHSATHILEVLNTASSLIRDESWSVLTPSDAGILCFATLLHDCAMHLTEDGFLSLLHNPTWQASLTGERPWPQMWVDFLSEASRFDGRKLTDLFGSNEPVHRPDADPTKWQQRDRLLIGEFVRRHHARLAHEIALSGVPGPAAKRLKLTGVPEDLAGLSGLIARSHGLHLRECLIHLDPTDPREYKGVHAIYLMALLRIADYLQIQAERAPHQLLQVKTLRSPASEREWRTHLSVVDIRHTHADPEALFVQAAPADSKSYLKLKRLLQGLQAELDNSWAVMGEVYGRFSSLAQLGITIRRVRSNLDDEKTFAATVPYIPCDAKFDTAGADLLKLLIHPLYGDHPEFGIRELMQNAIDACLELNDFLAQEPTTPCPDLTHQDADVVITLSQVSKTERYLIVSDRGIGMTSSVVLNYFLRAGASFRRSDLWRQQHEDDRGQSRVLRSGRFGVGALAAFLLGDEIEVSTRHVTVPSGKGISFDARLESEELQLNHFARPVGTTIRVAISDDKVWSRLAEAWFWAPEDREGKVNPLRQWDFYCISGITVKRILLDENSNRELPQQWHFPPPSTELLPPWHRLVVAGYNDIQWLHGDRSPLLISNGILVEGRKPYDLGVAVAEGFSLRRPTVSVFDPDGLLPLNLQRTDLAVDDLPFQNQLLASQCEDFVAWALVNAPTAAVVARGVEHLRYPNAIHQRPRHTFAFSERGSVFVDSWTFQQLSPTKVIFFPSTAGVELRLKSGDLLIPLDLDGAGADIRKAWFRCVVDWNWRDAFKPFEVLKASGRRIILRTPFYKALRKPGVVAQFLWSNISVESANKKWTILCWGDCRAGRIDFEELLQSPEESHIEGFTECFSGSPTSVKTSDDPGPSLLARVWKNIAGEAVIPYDLDQRKEHFREAYTALRPMIDFYDELKRKNDD